MPNNNAEQHSLIDTAALLTFGEGEIVPIKRTVSTLALAVEGLSETKADGFSYDGTTLSLLSGETVLDSVEISGGGGGVSIGDVTDTYISASKNVVTLKWD